MAAPTSVAVVVPNWNGSRLLPACLDSLLAQTRAPDAIVVVDDASTDDSRELLARRYPSVRVVALETNRGFPGAVNAGIAATSTSFVALLNNDAMAAPDWIERLLEAAASRTEFDAFACRMTKASPDVGIDSTAIDSAGLALARGFAQLSIGDGDRDGPAYDSDREVLGACGGAAMYRRGYLDACRVEAGPFDERYFAYFEDYDLALRGLARGFRTLYVGAARVSHLGSATLGRHSARGTRLYARNSLLVIGTSVPFAVYATECVHLELARLRMLLLAATRGRFLACVLGLIAGKWLLLRELVRRVSRPLATSPGAGARLRAFLREGEAMRRSAKERRAAEHPR